jgi:hypothetical protein
MSRFVDHMLRYFPVPGLLDPVYPALDISQSSVKYASKNEYDIIFLPHGCIEKGVIEKRDILIDALQKIKVKYDVTRAHISLPEEFAYVFPIMAAGGTAEEQKMSLEFEISEHVPVPQEYIQHAQKQALPGVFAITAYDSRESQKYEDILGAMGIVPVSCTPHIVAAARACIDEKNRETSFLVVDIGTSRTSCAFIHNACVLRTITVYEGSDHFIQTLLLAEPTLSKEVAYARLSADGFAPGGALYNSLLSTMCSIKSSIGPWLRGDVGESVRISAPARIYVTGGSAVYRGVCETVSFCLDLPAEVVRLESPSGTLISPRFAAASGLQLLHS